MPLSVKVLSAAVEFVLRPFSRPLQLSFGTITEITEAIVTVQVRLRDGTEATGRGSIFLSDLWAWPEPSLTHDQRDAVLRKVTSDIAASLPDRCAEWLHPAEHGLRLHEAICSDVQPGGPGPLALAVCLSPFDAALHDATGHALGRSAFSFYREDVPIPSLDALFPDKNGCAAVRRLLREEPAEKADGWYVVSGTDPLEEDFAMFVKQRGFRAFKLKTHGKDAATDAARTSEVYRRALAMGVTAPRISADSNEGNPDAESVTEYLARLRELDVDAWRALEYLEQPTGRDIVRLAYDWRTVSAERPVFLDEGLTSLDLLPLVVRQGWSGICLKTCKGHSFNLAAGAWAIAGRLQLTMQDLTNPGLSAIHSCLMAQHTRVLNGIELNSPQFTPAANADWLPRLACVFEPTDGAHRVPDPLCPGLGSRF